MKILYIESKLKNKDLILSINDISLLPHDIEIVYSIQYKNLAISIKKELESHNIKIHDLRQVFGCSKIGSKHPILFIGSGLFHVLNLFLQAKKIFILESNHIKEISSNDIEMFKNHKKASLLRFYSSKKVGILITTKPGQKINNNILLKLKKKLENQGKEVYFFLSNNIDINQFENFNIDSWINTACPGLSYDNPKIINYKEII
jgi:diphthamide biosynthesis enzyme Dph1/Dph2-like protein